VTVEVISSIDVARRDFVRGHAHRFAGVANLAHHVAEFIDEGVERTRDLRDFVVAGGRQALCEVAFAGADGVHGVAHFRQTLKRNSRDRRHDRGGDAGDHDQRDHRSGQQRTHAGRRFGFVERDDRVPIRAGNRLGTHQLRAAVHVHFQRTVGTEEGGEFVARQGRRHVGDRLQGQFRVGMRDDMAARIDQHAEARRRRMNRLDVGDHAVHRDVAGDHAFHRAIAHHGRGERYHQFARAHVHVRRRHHRLARRRGLLVPGTAGRIVVGRNAGRIGELRGLVRVADIHVRELASRGDLLQRGGRIGLQHCVLQRVDHLAVGGDPVADAVRVTAFDRGQAAVDRIGVVRVGDDIVENRVGGERDHNDSDAQGDDARANGGEHVGSLSE
jgi:hypothetical protein